ncbi:MAG: HAMP domain-containing protein, partial [Candidatus Binataceae bacterium]
MSIRLRLTIYWTIIIAGILLAAGLLIAFYFSNQMWGRLDSALHEEADTNAAALVNLGAASRTAMLRHLSQEKDLGPRRVRLLVNGRVAFDAGERNADLPIVPRLRAEAVVDGASHLYRYAIVPLQIDGQRAWLQDGVDARPVREAIAHLRRILLILLPIILLLCVVGGYWLSAEALRPLKEITAGLAGIGPRDLRRRLPVHRSHDEAGRLIVEINQLLARLERASASQ